MHTTDPAAAAWPLPNPDTPAPPGTHTLPLRFVGSGSEYFRIWIVNLLLTLVTLGLYYPFAKVRRLRYFHGATEVGGHAMSFHANPWTMFRGYVLVFLLLVAYAVAGQFSPAAGAVAFLVLALLWPALWHSSQRFRLANTGWRGLRFRYTGTRAQAYLVMGAPVALAIFVGALTVWALPDTSLPGQAADQPPAWLGLLVLLPGLLVLIAGPLFLWLIKRQQHRHYALGAQHTRFDVGAGALYVLVLKTLGVGVLVVLALGMVAFALAVLVSLVAGSGDGDAGSGPAWGVVLFGLLALLFYLLTLAVAGGFFTARLQNLVWNGTHTRHLRWASTLHARELARLWFTNAVLTVLTVGLYFPFAQVASARLRLQAVTVTATLDPEQLVAEGASADESAAGDAAGDLFGFNVGL